MENDELCGHDGMIISPLPWRFAGTVSYGNRDIDVITERLLSVLREMNANGDLEQRERESTSAYFNRLCSIANTVAPEDYFFGLSYGENHHWGFWELPF